MAWLLPQPSGHDPVLDELEKLFRQMTAAEQEEFLAIGHRRVKTRLGHDHTNHTTKQ